MNCILPCWNFIVAIWIDIILCVRWIFRCNDSIVSVWAIFGFSAVIVMESWRFFPSAEANNSLELLHTSALIRIFISVFLVSFQAEMLHMFHHIHMVSQFLTAMLYILLSALWLTHCSTNSEHMSCFLITKDSCMRFC